MGAPETGDLSPPRLSIVVTTRDRPALAHRAIDSALAQIAAVVEVIVVDDGSDQPFGTRHPEVRVIRLEESRGVCAARNVGLRAARGEWVTFLDDDDELLPQMAKESLHALATSKLPPPVAVLSAMAIVDGDGREFETRRPVTLLKGQHYFLEERQPGCSFQTHNTLVAPAQVLREIGGWDEEMSASEHDDLFLRLNQVCSIQGVGSVTYRHRDHAAPRLHSDLLARPEAMQRTLAKHRALFRQHRSKYAHYLAAMGATYLRAGKWWPAITATSRAVALNPLVGKHITWWLASLAGPKGLAPFRWLRGRLQMLRPSRIGSVQQRSEG